MTFNEDDFNKFIDALFPDDDERATVEVLVTRLRDVRAYLAAADVPPDLQTKFAGRLISGLIRGLPTAERDDVQRRLVAAFADAPLKPSA